MPKFKVIYFFDGRGVAIVEAENKKKAKEKFNMGDTIEDIDKSENYCMDSIKELEKEKNEI